MARANPGADLGEQIRTLYQVGSLGALSDGQLLDRFASGEAVQAEPAFAALVERHGPMVMGTCRRLLADPHLAEDAFQATFLVLARRAGSVRRRDALGGWLHRVARRVALRARRRADRHRGRERPQSEEPAVIHADRVEHAELRAVIDEEVDRLGDAQRLPVVLCCLEGLSHEEASLRLRWPLGTLKSRLARGRRRLQDRLVRRGIAPALAASVASGLLVKEASAAVAPALAAATARAAVASLVSAGTVPALVSLLVKEELHSMRIARFKFAATLLAAGASATLIGLAVASAPREDPSPEVPRVAAAEPKAEKKPEPPRLAAKLSGSGTVVDPAGKPIAEARVFLREWAQDRTIGISDKELEKLMRGEGIADILAETRTGADGRFAFRDVPAPSFPHRPEAGTSYFPWDVAALATGHGLAWVQLTPHVQRTPITLTLGPEGRIRGRVVEPGGKPVVAAKVKVVAIDPLERQVGSGVETGGGRLNLNWSSLPLDATTDADGGFAIAGLPRDIKASLLVTEPHHERVVAFAATTETPQPDNVSRLFSPSGKPTETRQPVHTRDFTLIAKKTDHVLTGRIVLEADGKPAAGATLMHGWTRARVDANGRFRIEGLAAGPVDLHAILEDSDAAPLDVEIALPETPKTLERDLVLPRGLVLNGRVVDGTTGNGVEGVTVTFVPSPEAERVPSQFGFIRKTDASGRYRLVVPPGKGTLSLRTIPLAFAQPERQFDFRQQDPKFMRSLKGRGGERIDVAEFKLSRGQGVVLRVLDPDGRPVANAQVDIRDLARGFNPAPGHTDADGRYSATGLSPEHATVVDITAAGRSLGATVEIPGADSKGPNGDGLEVRLQPLVTLSGRVLDEDGRPLAAPRVLLYRDVSYPGQGGRSFGQAVATLNEVEPDGTYTFKHLIPGATYNTQVEVAGHATATSNHVKIKAGQPVRLEDFRLPAAAQAVKGVVVDPAGKPVAGATVAYDRTDRTRALYAPEGSAWFHTTDASGRFHLTGLPRGPVRLQAYRSPGVADRPIRSIKYVEVPPGQAEVRIELPNPDDRLRGIE